MELLSAADADASIKNSVGGTALDMAQVEKHEVATYLQPISSQQ